MYCSNCGAQMEEKDVFCAGCGAKNEEVVVDCKKKYVAWAVIAIIAVVAAVAIIIGTSVKGPAYDLYKAAKKTLGKESFTIEFEYDDGENIESILQVQYDLKERELMLYCEEQDEDEDGRRGYFAIYDEQYIYGAEYSDGDSYCYSYDISDELDEMFDAYEASQSKDFDWDNVIDIIEETGIDIDKGEFEKCALSYVKLLNNKSWLKENLGYSKSKQKGVSIYSFEPDVYQFLNDLLKKMEPAFDDEDVYDDIKDELRDNKSDFKDVDITFSIGIKSGYIVSGELCGEYDADDEVEIVFEVKDIGKTEIDVDELEDLLDEAEEY